MPSNNQNRAYRVRTTAEADEYHIVAAPNPKRARFHFAMHLKNSRKAEEFLLALKLIRCCDLASEYDAWATGAFAGTIKTEKKLMENVKVVDAQGIDWANLGEIRDINSDANYLWNRLLGYCKNLEVIAKLAQKNGEVIENGVKPTSFKRGI